MWKFSLSKCDKEKIFGLCNIWILVENSAVHTLIFHFDWSIHSIVLLSKCSILLYILNVFLLKFLLLSHFAWWPCVPWKVPFEQNVLLVSIVVGKQHPLSLLFGRMVGAFWVDMQICFCIYGREQGGPHSSCTCALITNSGTYEGNVRMV